MSGSRPREPVMTTGPLYEPRSSEPRSSAPQVNSDRKRESPPQEPRVSDAHHNEPPQISRAPSAPQPAAHSPTKPRASDNPPSEPPTTGRPSSEPPISRRQRNERPESERRQSGSATAARRQSRYLENNKQVIESRGRGQHRFVKQKKKRQGKPRRAGRAETWAGKLLHRLSPDDTAADVPKNGKDDSNAKDKGKGKERC